MEEGPQDRTKGYQPKKQDQDNTKVPLDRTRTGEEDFLVSYVILISTIVNKTRCGWQMVSQT